MGDTIVLTSGNIGVEYQIRTFTGTTGATTKYILPALVAAGTTFKIRKRVSPTNFINTSRGVKTFELIWKPCLGLFDIDGFLPSMNGLYNLRLTPHPEGVYQKFAIESMGEDKTSGSSNDFIFSIVSIHMYILKGIGTPIVNKSLTLDVKEIRCQSQNLTTSSVHQKTFQVHPRTNALTLAFQKTGAGHTATQFSAAKFKCGDSDITNADELKLTRFWVRYGGKQLPTPIKGGSKV